MLESYFSAPWVLNRMRSGLMAPYLDTLAAGLAAQEYSRKSIRRQLHNADAFGWWLTEQNLTVVEITDDLVNRYVGGLHRSARAGYAKGYSPHNARGLPRLLDLLRAAGVLPPVSLTPTADDFRLRDFDQYLDRVRGAAPGTRAVYLHEARCFLEHVLPETGADASQIRPDHVVSYVTARAAQLSATCRRHFVTPLRSFLRYMAGQGLLPSSLDHAIPLFRQWRHAVLPAALSREDLEKVLAAYCERTVKDLRNRAILLLLGRLGLRAGEVVRLCLEDFDWRQGRLLVRAGKNHRERILPLPEDLGEALTSYLKDGRPLSNQREVFLNLCWPHRPLRSSQAVRMVATQALRVSGVSTPRPGAHLFRRTVATHMVCRGVTFKAVSDVLGHCTLGATGIYAKLDLASLAKVALPWPGGAR